MEIESPAKEGERGSLIRLALPGDIYPRRSNILNRNHFLVDVDNPVMDQPSSSEIDNSMPGRIPWHFLELIKNFRQLRTGLYPRSQRHRPFRRLLGPIGAADISKTIDTISEISATIASAVEEQNAVTKEISSNMQTASAGVQAISQNMSQIVSATKSANEATRKVKEASVALAS